MKPVICQRFNCNVWITHHAEMMMLERKISQTELMNLIETGDIKRKSENHWWFYKDFPGRGDNLVCAAVQKTPALIVKIVMINWQYEDE